MQFAHDRCLSIPHSPVSTDLPAVYISGVSPPSALPIFNLPSPLLVPSFTLCCNAHVTPSNLPPAPFRDAKSVDSPACQRERTRLNGCFKAQTTLTSRPSCLCRLLLKHRLHSLRQRDSLLLAQSLVSYFRWAPNNNAPRPSGVWTTLALPKPHQGSNRKGAKGFNRRV